MGSFKRPATIPDQKTFGGTKGKHARRAASVAFARLRRALQRGRGPFHRVRVENVDVAERQDLPAMMRDKEAFAAAAPRRMVRLQHWRGRARPCSLPGARLPPPAVDGELVFPHRCGGVASAAGSLLAAAGGPFPHFVLHVEVRHVPDQAWGVVEIVGAHGEYFWQAEGVCVCGPSTRPWPPYNTILDPMWLSVPSSRSTAKVLIIRRLNTAQRTIGKEARRRGAAALLHRKRSGGRHSCGGAAHVAALRRGGGESV